MKVLRLSVIAFVNIFYVGCGGNDAPNRENTSPISTIENETLLEGVFVDYIVSGVNYDSKSVSGITDDEGKFLYKSGEDLEFFIGDIILGEAAGKALITPSDISPHGERNIVGFLISIDDDALPENGIQITDSISEAANLISIDFNEDESDFYRNESVNESIRRLTAGSSAGQRDIVSASVVEEHLNLSEQMIISASLFELDLSKISSYKSAGKVTGTINYNYHGYDDDIYHAGGHAGIDFVIRPAVEDNDLGYFYSLSNGEVISAGITGMAPSCSYSDSSNIIAIYDRDTNKTVIYLHASVVNVTLGQSVSIGTKLGQQGNAGNSTGDHVHVEVREGRKHCAASSSEGAINPVDTIIGYLKAKKEPEVEDNPVTISGYVYNQEGSPVARVKVTTSLDSTATLTNSSGYFKLITLKEGNGNYANTPYTITVKADLNSGYEELSSTRVWGDNPEDQVFVLNDSEKPSATENIVSKSIGNDLDALISPNGGEHWFNGENQTIQWASDIVTGDKVDLYVLHDNPDGLLDKDNENISSIINAKKWHKIVSSIDNTGSFSFDPVAMSGTGNAYMVLVVSRNDNSKFDMSDGTFSLN